MDFSNIYLFSDIDGTLGVEGVGIPQRNVNAISRFVENGGTFSLCTGRWASDIKRFTKDVPVNGTCIINNGGALYDYSNGKSFELRTLPKQTTGYLKRMLRFEEFLDVLAVTKSGFFRVFNHESSYIPNDEDINRRIYKLEKTHSPQLKIAFTLPPHIDANEKLNLWNSWDFPGVSFTRVDESCIEMLPKGVNKGSALNQLCSMQGIPLSRTYFIGDSYNDREMFKTAGFSACVAETPPELKRLCDCVLGKCLDGALADFIMMLEKMALRSA